VHPVFLLKAFLAFHVRDGDNAGQNKAKKSAPRALEPKPKKKYGGNQFFRLSDFEFLFDEK